MSSTFDHIEDHLRNFIEKSIQLLPENNRLHTQLLQLARSLQNYLQQQIETEDAMPATITINFHPDNLALWRTHPAMLEYLRAAIHDLANDQRISAPVAPAIHLEIDPSLPLEIFTIRSDAPLSSAGETKAISSPHKPADNFKYEISIFYLINENNNIFPFWETAVNIGRSPQNDLVIDDPRVSRLHAQIRSIHDVHHIFDLNSRGGLYVNGKQVYQAVLKSGDVISLAGWLLRYLTNPPQN